jgi:hypothetical protein
LFNLASAAALLSFLFPGLGQAAAGRRLRGVIVAMPALALLALFGSAFLFDRNSLASLIQDQQWLTGLMALNLLLFGYHAWAVLDAYLLAARARRDSPPAYGLQGKWGAVLVVGVLLAGTVGVHAAAAEVDQGWQHSLDCHTGAIPCGWDISYPQCHGKFPTDVDFAIVGVNKGIVFSANPCLAAGDGPPELTWAGGATAQLYMNTGNPGPDLSSRWPNGQTSPRQCNPVGGPGPDTAECAYDYGWNAAADAYKTAVGAYVSLGLAAPDATRTPAPNLWWLDVETTNSWREDVTLNVAGLEGAAEYLESVGVAGVGFYSTRYQWGVITGGTTVFAAHPSWVAGAGSARAAVVACFSGAFTGGRVAMVQYPADGFDANFLC